MNALLPPPTQSVTPFELREYQARAIRDARTAIRDGKRRILVVQPTGTGKGSIAAEIMRATVHKGGQTIFAVHRREIVRDLAKRLERMGVYASVVLPGEHPSSYDKAFVGTVQSLNARMGRGSLNPENVRTIVVDEAHHFNPSKGMYKTLVDNFPNAVVIGLTATPCGEDGRALGSYFETLVQPLTFSEAFDGGWLVRPRYFAPNEPDLSSVRTVAGDYALDEVDELMRDERLVGDVVSHYARYAQGRQAVLFAPRRASARAFQQRFIAAGFIADYVDGETPTEERDAIFAAMSRGEIEVLCNVDVTTEGWDEPKVSCAIFCRPTKSARVWIQALGRVLRPADGKSDALILDHTGTLNKLGFLEDYEEWTLTPNTKDKAAAKRKSRTTRVKESKIVTCDNCAEPFQRSRTCPACGWVIPPSCETEELFEENEELVARSFTGAVDKNGFAYTTEEKARWYAMLLHISRSGGRQDGWAKHKYKSKFGVWPARSGGVEPIAPSREVTAFVQAEKRRWLNSDEGKAWLEKRQAPRQTDTDDDEDDRED
ncbi:MAG: DEAD/DEAH box helicase family protein [Pleurocapsa sp. SU_196_0]|nr:DEAD/DEAH box helicase family protein [Pleurocapsa sp. SU_196_0]